jgi:hypothetical protein
VLHGLSSGEGLIYAVRDRAEGENKKGEKMVVDEGVEDKRLLVLEAELAGVLKVMNREGNTLSPVIRQAWDDGALQTLTKNRSHEGQRSPHLHNRPHHEGRALEAPHPDSRRPTASPTDSFGSW